MEKRRKRVYLNSNVFISLFNEEIGAGFRGLFAEAEAFIELVKKEGHTLVLSKWFFEEVYACCYMPKADVLSYFGGIGIKVETAESHRKGAWKEFVAKGIHFSDSLHAAMAIDCKCDCIVTFNIKDFEKISGTIVVMEPAGFL